jgi:hypothetical protein
MYVLIQTPAAKYDPDAYDKAVDRFSHLGREVMRWKRLMTEAQSGRIGV